MEAARLGLHDFPLSALGGRGPPGHLGALNINPSEPWAAAAAAAAIQCPTSLSSLSHALPGFLSHPQVLILLCTLGVKIRNLNVDFKTGGTWLQVEQ